MTTDWSPLETELAIWRAQRLPLSIWWRDDDAITPTPALTRLTRLADDLEMPLHIAVVPKRADAALAAFTQQTPGIVAMVHGWQHVSHAPPGAKKAEFGHPRPDAAQEAYAAITRMRLLFQDNLLPVFVPPWNRIDAGIMPALAAAGYCGVSTYAPRPARLAATGLVQINTQLDPINWKAGRGLVPPETQIAQMVRLLQERRSGDADNAEPLGMLTHHLVHDDAIWAFTRTCLAKLLEGGAVPADVRALTRI